MPKQKQPTALAVAQEAAILTLSLIHISEPTRQIH